MKDGDQTIKFTGSLYKAEFSSNQGTVYLLSQGFEPLL